MRPGLLVSVALLIFIFLGTAGLSAQVFISEYCNDPLVGTSGPGIDPSLDGMPATSGSQGNDEFVEIVNAGAAVVDISNWTLSDGILQRHVFDVGTLLPSGAAIVVFGGGNLVNFNAMGMAAVAANQGSLLGLQNSGDSITLTDDFLVTVDTVTWLSGGAGDGDGESITRDPETPVGVFTKHTLVAAGGGIAHSAGFLNDGTTPWPSAFLPGPTAPAYPGTTEDFIMETGISGGTSTGPGNDIKTALAGDSLNILAESPAGTFNGAPFLILAELFPTGAPPVGVLPTLHLSLSGFFILVDGAVAVGPGLVPGLPAAGSSSSFLLPPGLTGSSLLLQSLALSPTAANTLFAISDAHEIQML